MEHCVSQYCWKGEISQNKSSAYILECTEGFLNQNCETNVNECSPKPCQNGTDCIDIPKVSLNLTYKGVALKYILPVLSCLKSTNN